VSWQAVWLDLDPAAGPRQLKVECAHGSLSLPVDWLRRQIQSGIANRVVDAAARAEMQ
jgi:hypothetical protein